MALIQGRAEMHTSYQNAILNSQTPDGVDYMAMRRSLGESCFTHRRIHAPSSERGLKSIERLWIKHISSFHLDPREELDRVQPEIYITFLIWMVHTSRKKELARSTVETRWKNFRIYRYNVTGKKMDEVVGATVIKWINESGPLITSGAIHLRTRPKPTFCNQDLGALLEHLWRHDPETFAHERYRIQMAFLTQLTSYTSGRPGSMMPTVDYIDSITYQDFLLLKIPFRNKTRLVLLFTNNFYKGRRYKNKPVTFIMYQLDEIATLPFCPVLNFLALAFADDAFLDFSTPEDLFSLEISEFRNGQVYHFKDSVLEQPILRRASRDGASLTERPWSDDDYRAILSKCGMKAGFKEDLLPYALRRGCANAVIGKSTSVQLMQIMGHTDPKTMRHYLSSKVQVDTQSGYLGLDRNDELFLQVGSMSLDRDTRAPWKLDSAQIQALEQQRDIVDLKEKRESILKKIIRTNGSLCKAKESASPLLQEYSSCDKNLTTLRGQKRDQLLQEVRTRFFKNINSYDIRQQLGTAPIPDFSVVQPGPIQLGPERAAVAASLYSDGKPSYEEVIKTLIQLAKCPGSLNTCSFCGWESYSSLNDHLQEHLDEELNQVDRSLSCIFCLTDRNLPIGNRLKCKFSKRANLKRHINQYHASELMTTRHCPMPQCHSLDPENPVPLKTHLAKIHSCFV
ncbi:hypothetical protein TWF102_004622 [Orbilia oligospora]|uniref:Uncharacterized protein n=1 Tax=Orbilia oligospora TaxID=2813651 RepID=A0A7C8MX75_ORBOL|nr:hypothetical protein TWF102_004622 [Orbilia oligospora]